MRGLRRVVALAGVMALAAGCGGEGSGSGSEGDGGGFDRDGRYQRRLLRLWRRARRRHLDELDDYRATAEPPRPQSTT